uniref:Ciliogenesis-associated TTC17-interacting protein n=1 Tax=Monodelphis domestica TaxID=13616 RepID=F6WFD2_MONDO
ISQSEPEVPPEPPPPPLEVNSEALEFLASLSKEEIQLLYFSETLCMVSESGQPLGEYTVDIRQAYFLTTEGEFTLSALVHATSRGQLDEIPCGTSISGRSPHQLFLPMAFDRKITLMRRKGNMVMTRSVKEGEAVKTEKFKFNLNIMNGFISESANLVLLRVMGWRRKVPHNAKFLTFDAEGKLCHSTYESLGFQTIQLGSERTEAMVVEQTMHSDEDIPMTWQYYLLADGFLIFSLLFTFSSHLCSDEIEPKPVFGKKSLDWEEDPQLFAIFRDRKEELQASHTTYMRRHPEAQTLISDFLLFLLLRQPTNVVTFAAEYFGPFARNRPPPPPFRSSNRPSPFRNEGYSPPGEAGNGA